MSCGRCCEAETKDEVAVATGSVSSAPGFNMPLEAALGGGGAAKPEAPDEAPEPRAFPAEDGAVDKLVSAPSSTARPTKTEARVFTATIPKGQQKLGIDINYHDTMTLLVTKVNAGPVESFNRLNPDIEIGPGDRVVDVNGVTGDTGKMLEACKQSEEILATVKRCEERVVTLEKGTASDELGLSFEVCDGMTLLITMVEDESIVGRHNATNPDFNILKEDRIIGVNGVRSDSQKLQEALRQSDKWELVTRRVWKKG